MTTTEPAVATLPSDGPSGPGDGSGDGRGSAGGEVWWRRRAVWVIAAVALVVVALVAVAVWPAHHRSSPTPTHTVLPPVKPLVSAGAGELVALLQAGQRSSYHARYRVTGDPATIGGSQDLEIWNAPPRQRADTTRTNDGHTYRSETIKDAASTSLCVKQDAAAWSCQRVAQPSPGDVDPISTSVIAATSGQPVAVTNDTLSGRKVRCFIVATPTGSLRLCATLAGVPVVIANAAVSYQLVTLDTKVGTAIFKTPAPVQP